MKELSVRLLITGIGRCCIRIKALAFLLLVLLCFTGSNVYSAVVITAPTGGTNICSSKAIGGSAPAYTTIGNIVITEGLNADLSGPGTDLLVLSAPTGWQFNTVTLPSITYITGSNIIPAPAFTITATSITITIPTNGTNGSDQFSINGLQVQATSTSAVAGYIYPSAVTGISGLTTGSTGTNFGNLSLTTPLAPAVNITASPPGTICPGINVLFSPNPTNGGPTPAYQWYLNGTSVVTGATYSNNSLTSGNTVSCIMTASGTCLTAATAASNSYTVTVTTGPLPVNGATVTCPGTTISLSDNTTGGVWSSSNTAIATTDVSGNVTGVGVGTAIISYTAGTCASTANITVNSPPVAPVLTTTVSTMCSGDVSVINATGVPFPSIILSQNFNSGLAPWIVDSTGSIGTFPGSAWKVCGDGYINDQGTYHSLDNSAFVMANADTSHSSSYISSKLISPVFSLSGYTGATLTFQQAYEYWPAGDTSVSVQISTDGGSTWSTLQNYVGSNVGNRTGFVGETFSLNGYLGQTNLRLRFYYYCHWGYYWAIDNILISGVSSIVIPVWSPSTYLYTDAAYTTPYSGGALNTVYVHPSSIGTAGSITYTATAVSTGCSVANSSVVNFTPTPSPITGTANVCVGATTNLTDVTLGGTWSSGSTGIATVVSGGAVTGVAAGTAKVTYMLGTGCYTTTIVTVNSLPATISGNRSVCIGATTSLSDATSGGSWISGNTAVATIGTGTGNITSVGAGTANITYTLGTGCNSIIPVTVNPLPATINGNTTVCVGSLTNLSDTDHGGTWSSGFTGIATIGSISGNVTGVTAGSAMITYTLGTGCAIAAQVSVDPLALITGATTVCSGSTTTLSSSISGGTWNSNNTSIATVATGTGAVTGGTGGGVTTISYTLPTGCISTTTFTVNPLPATITGTMQVCVGANTNLTDAIAGGTWSAALTSIAIVGSSNGVVHGVNPGSTTIKYSLATGCFITATVTVNILPQAILGNESVCAGLSTSLSDLSAGGTWLSNDASIASIGSAGVTAGVTAGSTSITYILPTGCIAATNFTVDPLPTTINGNNRVCTGLTTSLSDGTPAGTWASSNNTVATIGSTDGVVNGAEPGTAMVTYTLATGCITTKTITVDPLPGAINGIVAVCSGSATVLSNSTTGGVWSSGTGSIATIGSTGIVTGIASGTSVITYVLSTGCVATTTITVNPLPGNINGTTAVCQGSTTTLSDAAASGVWSSSDISVGSIGPASGIVTGINAGTTTITYTLNTGCIAMTVVTVSALPAAISGTGNVCQTTVMNLNDATAGGTWSSTNTTVAVVGTTTGNVTGLTTGTSTISYTIPVSGGIGCSISTTVTVNPLPSGITGASGVCTGAATNLTDGTSGGTWSSNNILITTIGSTGVLTGVSAGATTITYTLPTGCVATKPVNVNQTPAAITGTTNICAGATTSLSDAYSGGTWASSNTGIAAVGSATGIVSGGASAGTTNITYALSGGCFTNSTITVNLSPANITGAGAICAGATTNLSNAITGGTWSSSNTSVATINLFGLVNGAGAGTAGITYTLNDGCAVNSVITVNVMPGSINGVAKACVGLTTSLFDNVTGGTWASSNTSVAIAGSLTGIVNGLSAGTAAITYGFPTGCIVTTLVTVNASPGSISGNTNVCLGLNTNLSDAVTGGAWSSSNTGVATIGTTGFVTPVSAGTAAIFYTLPSGCAASRTITIYPLPSVIDGTTNICAGTVTILTDSVSGGTWTSNNTTVATVGTGSGALTGIGAGTVTISYSFGPGCTATTLVTVNVLPSSISGNNVMCVAATATLSDPIGGGGIWSSSDISIAKIGSLTGVVLGIGAGTATITYSLGVGCTLATIVTVNPLPTSIIEATDLCYGSTIILSDAATGGTWSSSNPGIATINSSTGTVSGITTGTVHITYKLGTGCQIATTVTVYPLPASISGSAVVCAGATTNLTDVTAGGTWSSGSPGIATIGSTTGIINGVAAGTGTISYILATGCFVPVTVTVNPLPSSINGNNNVCAGLTTNLTDATGGGTWSSSNISVGTLGSVSGIVNGIIAGTSNITYTLTTGCISITTLTVLSLPSAINGITNVCQGLSVNLSDLTAGGAWSSNDLSIAAIDPSTGNLTGVTAGNTMVTYTVGGTGCIATAAITVDPLPAVINGTMGMCNGATTILSDVTASGGWSSGDPLTASVGSGSGVVTGVAAGTTSITYTIATGCIQTTVVTVDPLPSPIGGVESVCAGFATNLTDITTGGTWSNAGAAGIATVDATSGMVTGISAGTALITYTLPTGCFTTSVFTVNPLPAAISGSAQVCAGLTINLSDASSGGTWTSNATTVATVGLGTGIVSGFTSGVTTVTYTMPTGCIATTNITVNPLPGIILGANNVCAGLTTTLSDLSTGGIWNIAGAPGIASIDPATGIITGTSAGAVIVTYTISTGCISNALFTVNPLPAAIAGVTNVCVGLAINLTDASTGGNWSSSDISTAGVGATTGVVTGITAGSAAISYTLGTGCLSTTGVTVNPLPTVITGAANVCAGSQIALSNAITGGTWSSGSPAVATIGTDSGIVTGLVAGTSNITYTLSTGCIATTTITINLLPATITGTMHVCAGLTVNLSDVTGGGAWSSSAAGVGSVNTTGIVTGISAGTAVITYALPTGCLATANLTVNPLPAVIAGITVICTSNTTTLSNLTAGGHWSTVGGIASIGSGSGIVTGLSAGTALITYTLPTGCISTITETVFGTPLPISGSGAVCSGSTLSLSDVTSSGTWISSNTATADVGPVTGIVTGAAAGTASITYSLGTGCFSVAVVTVDPLPSVISGLTAICTGHTSVLSDIVTTGHWSLSPGSSGIATVGLTSGLVTALASGTAVVSYTLSTGCYVTSGITINPSPAAITGTTIICAGLNTSLSDITTSGAWSSSNSAIANVATASGIVTGVSAGTATVSYILSTGCYAVTTYTVNPLPSVIAGNRSVCIGSTATFSDALAGGVWNITGSAGIAGIGAASGIVTGISLGTANVTYTLPTGCFINAIITVNPYPVAITGAGSVCQGDIIHLSDATIGGAWGSSNTSVAAVNPSGAVTGISGGSVTISYTLSTGCYLTRAVTVNPIFPITGSTNICAGAANVFGDLTPGGTWSSNNSTVATIGTSTGVATAIASGTTVISYALNTGCFARVAITVNAIPASYYVIGGGNYCTGSSGVIIGLNGSDSGIIYKLYKDTSFIASKPGNDSAVYYGPYTTTGIYTIIAVNMTTGCTNTMSGTDTIGIAPVTVPSVSITTPTGDTLCQGAHVTFTAVPVNGGASPTYKWYVNGALVATATSSTYNYLPANGDVVSVRLTSNAACVAPDTAHNSFTVVTTPYLLPSLSISVSPGDSLCALVPVTITPLPVNGGSSPSYRWIKNGVTAGLGSTYNYTPSNGDNVFCVLYSNYRCLVGDTANSANNINFTVTPLLVPTVTISAHPGLSITSGQSDTLSAIVINGGAAIIYQWKINGTAIPGATSDTFIYSNFMNNDTVVCVVNSSNVCGGIAASAGVIMNVNNVGVQQVTSAENNIEVLPNPNNGDFIIKGSFGNTANEQISLEITNMFGQVVYQKNMFIHQQKLYEKILLDPSIPNGIYLIHVSQSFSADSQSISKVLHFVVKK